MKIWSIKTTFWSSTDRSDDYRAYCWRIFSTEENADRLIQIEVDELRVVPPSLSDPECDSGLIIFNGKKIISCWLLKVRGWEWSSLLPVPGHTLVSSKMIWSVSHHVESGLLVHRLTLIETKGLYWIRLQILWWPAESSLGEVLTQSKGVWTKKPVLTLC